MVYTPTTCYKPLATSMLKHMPSEKMTHLLEPQHPAAAPPPMPVDRVTATYNPYEFITNSGPPAKKRLLPGGNSKISRLIIAAAIGVGLIFAAILIISLLGRTSGGVKTDYQSLVGQQAELIRVSDVGIAQAKGADTRNLAVTTRYSLQSAQPTTLGLAKKAGAKTDAKTLALGRNTKTDSLLAAAAQSNQFDEVFNKTIKESLQKYQKLLKKIYSETSGRAAKKTLEQSYLDVTNLIGNPATKL